MYLAVSLWYSILIFTMFGCGQYRSRTDEHMMKSTTAACLILFDVCFQDGGNDNEKIMDGKYRKEIEELRSMFRRMLTEEQDY